MMALKDIKPSIVTMEVQGEQQRIRFDLNALDYLERIFGNYTKAFTEETILARKHIIRAALLCNYSENIILLEQGKIEELKPTLSEVGAFFDIDSINAVSEVLLEVLIEQTSNGEGEERLGEKKKMEYLLKILGLLSKLYGLQNLDKAIKIFGAKPQKKL